MGIAGASCTFSVYGIGAAVPGSGALVVQAQSSDDARDAGIQQMREGSAPQQILAAMREDRFDPENQQYGVVTLASGSSGVAYSGRQISGWQGSVSGDGFSVQGNILTGEEVVKDTVAAFHASSGESLAQRLMKALESGAAAGGDKRCAEQRARSAFVTVFNSSDALGEPLVNLVVYGLEKGQANAVELLSRQFQHWLENWQENTTTRLYMIPPQ